jgi:hypothetical protein
MRVLVALVFAILISGCATTKVLQPVPASTAGLAKVHFIRQKLEPVIREYRVVVNSSHVASLADNDVVAVFVPIGDNQVQLDIDNEWPFSFTLPVKVADPLYVVISGESTFAGAQSTGYRTFTANIALTRRVIPVSRAEAEKLLGALGKKLP